MIRNPALGAFAVVVLVIVSAAGYIYFLPKNNNQSNSTPHSGSLPGFTQPPRSPGSGISPGETKHAVIYVVSQTGGDENGLAPRTVSLRDSDSPARDAIQDLIASRHSPIPAGAHLRGIKLVDGVATVDFSREFQSNFHGGDTQEAQTINSILLTLGQFPDIDKVQILVEGKPIEALSQLSIADPLPVIRADTPAVPDSQGGTDNG
jgi:spore germination protein GerM